MISGILWRLALTPGRCSRCCVLLAAAIVVLFPSVSFTSAQTIPTVKAKALDDSDVILPAPNSRQFLILIVGFSHKSGEVCSAWGKHVSGDYAKNSRVNYFQIPVLQDAPSLVRPMILHGMRKGVPAQGLSHFVPIYEKESDWKKLVNFSAPDDAYLLITDPQGLVRWQLHGSFTDSAYNELKSAVEKMIPTPASGRSNATPAIPPSQPFQPAGR